MSRSRRHHPICPIACAESEKAEKEAFHKRLRLRHKKQITRDLEAPLAREIEIYDPVRDGRKDGKKYHVRCSSKWLRK